MATKKNSPASAKAAAADKASVVTTEVTQVASTGTETTQPVVKAESQESVAATPPLAVSPFAAAITACGESKVDKLHLENVIELTGQLLAKQKVGARRDTYRECASQLLSLVRSFSVMSDAVFTAAFPAFLDEYHKASQSGESLFTDSVDVFKIFSNSEDIRGLSKDHAQFLAATAELAPKASRKKIGNSLDIAKNFAIFPDSKRIRIKAIFR